MIFTLWPPRKLTGTAAVQARNIFCTKAGQATYYLVAAAPVVADNSSTTYTLNIADANFVSPVASCSAGQGGAGTTAPAVPSIGGITGAFGLSVWKRQGTVLAASAADEFNVQEANVLYEDLPQIIGGAEAVFKMWHSCGWATPHICYAESLDGINWTRYGGPIISDHTRSYVLKNGSTYMMYAQNVAGGLIDQLTSSEGIRWTVAHSAVLPVGPPGSWDDFAITNTYAWIEGGTWYMLYDAGDAGGLTYQVGLATSPDGFTWTKSASNPVIPSPRESATVGSIGGPWLVKVGDTYYAWFEVSSVGLLPSDITRYTSTDLIHWTQNPLQFVLERASPDEGAGNPNGQVADATLLEVGGRTYLWYEGYADGTTPTGNIKLAIADVPFSVLVQTNEGSRAGSFANLQVATLNTPAPDQIPTRIVNRLPD